MSATHRSRPAFTLVELLVVIGIIGLLIAMLMPILIAVRRRALQIQCANNLRQWGAAVAMYVSANNDRLPREKASLAGAPSWEAATANTWAIATLTSNSDVWYNAFPECLKLRSVAQYAESEGGQAAFYESGRGNIFHCPAAGFDPAIQAERPCFSLAINAKLMGLKNTGYLVTKLGMIRYPNRTPLMLDSGVPGESKYHRLQDDYDGRPHSWANRMVFSRHPKGRANVLMANLSVESVTGEMVVDPATGGAFYPPREVVWTVSLDFDPNRNR